MTAKPPECWHIAEVSEESVHALALVGAATFLDAFAGVLDAGGLIAHCREKHSADAYADYLAEGSRAFLASHQTGGAPIGFALIGTPDLPGAKIGDIELKRIYALSRFHGSGLGRALLDTVVAATAGHQRLVLGVYAKNHRAIAFYRKQGFHDIGTRQFNVGGTLHDDLVLALPLDTLHSDG